MRSINHKAFHLALIVAVITMMISPLTLSANSTNQPAVPQGPVIASTSIGAISVTGQTYFELEKASVLSSQGEGTNVVFTVSLHNNEDHDLFLRDYWIYLLTKGNPQIAVHLVTKDKGKNRVSAGTTERFTFYAALKGNIKLEDLRFKFIKWDFEVAGYEQTLGTISVSKDYSDITLASTPGQTIDISGLSVSTSVYKAQYSKNDKNVLVTITYQLENKGDAPVTIPDYQYYLLTSDGNKYKMLVPDASNLILAPLTQKKLMLYAELPSTTPILNWKLLIAQIDADSKLLLPVVQYELNPSKIDKKMISMHDPQQIELAETPLNTKITNILVNHHEDDTSLLINFQVANMGSRAVTIPALSFSIQTKEGQFYPAVNGNKQSLTISPNDIQNLALSVALPGTVSTAGLMLILNHPLTPDVKTEYPMAFYNIPKDVGSAVSMGQEHTFSVHNKIFTAKMNGINRYPWGEEDVITADFTLTNKEKSALALPDFSAYFLLDGKKKVEAKLLMTENVVTLKENASVHLVMIGKIPYAADFSTFQLVLLNTESDKTLTPLVEFTSNADFLEVPAIAEGESYSIADKGRKAAIKIHVVRTYTGVTKNILYLELELENQEKRFVNPAAFVAYFKTTDDLYFPLKLGSVSQQISPTGKVLIAGWAMMPKTYQLKDLKFMLGQGIAGNAFATEEMAPDAFVNAVNFDLPAENLSAQSSFSNVALSPYNLSMSKMMATFGSVIDTMSINFDYNLSKNSSDDYENEISGHKLLFEFVNSSSDTKFSTELAFEEGSGNVLQLGNHSTTLTFSDTNLMQKLKLFDRYTINLYDQYQGNKRLIASKSLRWFQLDN